MPPSPIRVIRTSPPPRPISPLTTHDFGSIRQQPRKSDPPILETSQIRDSPGSDEELVCDYDTNVTALYELLESSQWDQARSRCRTHPQEVRTWILRRDANTNQTRWKLLPLHAAVIFQAPTPVVASLLESFVAASSKRDDQGMLPLHLAFRHHHSGDETQLEMILQHYPAGVTVRDRRERSPLDHGKDATFSSKLMQLYASAHANMMPSDSTNGGANVEVVIQEQDKTHWERQVTTLKSVYEERLINLGQDHNQELDEMKRQSESAKLQIRKECTAEMDELRDLLARQVQKGQKAMDMELDVAELKDSLAHTQEQEQTLREWVRKHQNYAQTLQEQMTKILQDQAALQACCRQQSEELEESRQVRQQLLRTLLQKEDSFPSLENRTSNEMLQVSESIRLRMENLLLQAPPSLLLNSTSLEEHDQDQQQQHQRHGRKQQHDVVRGDQVHAIEIINDDEELLLGEERDRHHRHHRHHHRHYEEEKKGEWEPHHEQEEDEVDDDISAITEISQF
jgi:hypothetical protein